MLSTLLEVLLPIHKLLLMLLILAILLMVVMFGQFNQLKRYALRTMHNPYGEAYGNAMTLHVSGTSLDAQARYANGVKQILTEYFDKTYKYRPQDVIIIDGHYATKAYGQRSKNEQPQ